VGKTEGKKPLGRPRRREKDTIKMFLQDLGCGGMDWIGLTWDRDGWWALVNPVKILQIPLNAGNLFLAENRLASQG